MAGETGLGRVRMGREKKKKNCKDVGSEEMDLPHASDFYMGKEQLQLRCFTSKTPWSGRTQKGASAGDPPNSRGATKGLVGVWNLPLSKKHQRRLWHAGLRL